MSVSTSTAWLERLCQNPRDPEALKDLLDVYVPMMVAWLRPHERHLPSGVWEFATGVVGTVFLALCERKYDPTRRQADPPATFRGWLRTVMMNEVRNELRNRAPAAEAEWERAGTSETAGREVEWEVILTVINRVRDEYIAESTDERTRYLLQHILADMTSWCEHGNTAGPDGRTRPTYADLAAEVGMSEGAVAKLASRTRPVVEERLHRALHHLDTLWWE